MEKKIYWSSIEYSYSKNSKEAEKLKGGFVYALIKAYDAREALEKIQSALDNENMIPIEIEYISPYDVNMEWEEEDQTSHFNGLYEEAGKKSDVIFDEFYAYEKE